MNFQRIQIIGVVDGPAELICTATGNVAHFGVVVSEQWRDPLTGERTPITTTFPCTAFGARAGQAATVLKRGRHVFLEGRLRERRGWSITVDQFKLLDRGYVAPEDESQLTEYED